MNTNSVPIQVLRWAFAAVLVLAAMYAFYLAAFHTWAAGGPPSPNPEWHEMWAGRFLWMTLFFVASAVAVVWLLRRRAPTG